MVADRRFFHAGRPQAPAVFVGTQDGCGVFPSFALYNLTAEIPGHPVGSTVSAETLTAAGYAVPPSCTEVTPAQVAAAPMPARCVEVVAHPRGGWTLAVPVGAGSARIFRGNWDTQAAAWAYLYGPAT